MPIPAGADVAPPGVYVDRLLARGRAAAGRWMVDACTIQHPTGATLNTANGVITPTYTTVYSGPCEMQGSMSPSGQEVAEAHLAVLSPTLKVPIEVVGVVEGDLVTMTASRNDPELPGKTFRIKGPSHKSSATARRFQCIEVTS